MKRDKLMTALALPIIAVVFVTLYSSVFDEKLNLSGDNLNYYFLAKNLAERGTYALYNDVQQNLPQFFTYFSGLPTTSFRRTPNDEELIRGFAQEQHFPEFVNPCPSASNSKRREIKTMLHQLYRSNPKIKGNIFRAMSRVKTAYLLK